MVTDDWVSNRLQVHAQLMTPTGLWLKFKECGRATESLRWISFEDAPTSNAGLAEFEINDVNRGALRLLPQWKIDFAVVQFGRPIDNGEVELRRFPRFKLPRKFTMRVSVAREHEHAGGVHVEPMHNARIGKLALHAGNQAIGFARSDSGNGQ